MIRHRPTLPALPLLPLLALLVALTLVGTAPADAERRPSLHQTQRFLAPPTNGFGFSVAIDGDHLVIGAPDEDGPVERSGAAYVYEWRPGLGQWYRVARLTVADAGVGDAFGRAVTIDGDTVVVGAPSRGVPVHSAGAAYVFQRDAGGDEAWGLVAELTLDAPMEDDDLGISVALQGDTAAIGAREFSERPGSVHVFERDPLDPTAWTHAARLTAADGDPGDQLGFSVALDGDDLVAGAVDDEELGEDAGSAYVFRRDPLDPGSWVEAAKLLPSDGAEGWGFGTAVAIEGDLVVVGADQYSPHPEGTGAVYAFRRDGSDPLGWSELSKLVPADAEYRDAFGSSVALARGVLVVGADQRGPGWMYVFRRSTVTPDGWRRMAKVKASEADPIGDSHDFGSTVAIGDDFTVLVGDRAISPDGAAYTFRPLLVDPHTEIAGFCPGTITLATDGLTPDGRGQSYAAAEPGDTVLGGSPCVGTELDLGTPLFHVISGQAASDGTDHTVLDLDADDCGFHLQVIDLTSCAVGNVVQLP